MTTVRRDSYRMVAQWVDRQQSGFEFHYSAIPGGLPQSSVSTSLHRIARKPDPAIRPGHKAGYWVKTSYQVGFDPGAKSSAPSQPLPGGLLFETLGTAGEDTYLLRDPAGQLWKATRIAAL